MESGQYQAATGRVPDWWEDEPGLGKAEEIYLQAFWDLSTTRQFSPSLGPIPWNRIMEYGRWIGLEADMMRVFSRVVTDLDAVYLDHLRTTQKRETEMTRRSAKQRAHRR